MTQNIQLLSLFSFPGQIPKWDAYFRLLCRFTVAESCWGCRKWYKTQYSLEKGRTFPSGKYSSPCYLSIATAEVSGLTCCYLQSWLQLQLTKFHEFLIFFSTGSPLGLSSRGRQLLPCSWALQENPLFSVVFQSKPSPFWVASHPWPTAFMLQRLPSRIWGSWNTPLFITEEPRNPQTAFFYP